MKLVKLTKSDCADLQLIMETRVYNGLYNMKGGHHSNPEEMVSAFNVLAFLARCVPCDVEGGAAPQPKSHPEVVASLPKKAAKA